MILEWESEHVAQKLASNYIQPPLCYTNAMLHLVFLHRGWIHILLGVIYHIFCLFYSHYYATCWCEFHTFSEASYALSVGSITHPRSAEKKRARCIADRWRNINFIYLSVFLCRVRVIPNQTQFANRDWYYYVRMRDLRSCCRIVCIPLVARNRFMIHLE